MRPLPDDVHLERFTHLGGLTSTEAIVAWGGFWFRCRDGAWQLVDDEDLQRLDPGRHGSIGASSTPYGSAVVELLDEAGRVVARETTDERNHVVVGDLAPDTTYRYRITVDGEDWTAHERWDWLGGAPEAGGRLAPAGIPRRPILRTLPARDDRSPLRFAVLGDQGVGLQASDGRGAQQRRVADALAAAVELDLVRFVLTTGDNIYLGPHDTTSGTGDEDDDWYFSYYQPYRSVIERVPVFPSVGNHDASDTEASDDRDQLADNLFTDERFGPDARHADASSIEPGLNYRVRIGALVELTCIDTSLATELAEEHYFEHPSHREFLETSFPARASSGDWDVPWRIPFCHHPPYTAGPNHPNHDRMIEVLVPLFRRAGVRLAFAGHEHNFQHNVVDGVHHVVTGAGGKLRTDPPRDLDRAGTRSWAATCHACLVELTEDEAVVVPVGGVDAHGRPAPIERTLAGGGATAAPVRIRREG